MAAQAQSRQPELRKDAVTGRWVVFSPARSKRPSDLKSKSPSGSANESSDNCPFCAGNEHLCAPQIFRVPPDSAAEWRIRVIENLYPALDRNLGRPDGGGESGEVFKNHGASAGASLSHSHSQIIALPVVPPNVSTRLGSMKDHFSRTGKCSLCELPLSDLVIEESTHFISFVPFAATFAFEIWIVPKIHSQHFHDIDDEKAADLGRLLKLMLKKISVQLNDPPFNFMIQTSPLHTTASELPYAHWFLQIVPQLSVVGGFELGTGCYINPVFPEDAAKLLREVNVPVQ
ncbi:hypothetical protein CRG98_002287 [Punica granatum]|uniref:Uncharacterized protein n=1 Tax=Punica granatum TaxID=22663 RepID=A0A2I0L9H2_PUNGR|nr:hypothetical protein CRG98_002287 [Punica granatum]